jgi:2-polyprenyl-6-methoxyphenol hydroxylase-like FAD-dependent oxidoreductase
MDGAAGKRCAVVWSVSAPRASALQSADETAFCSALQQASHDMLGRISLAGERRVWPLQHAQARQWCGKNAAGSWVLAGDAAHNVHPLAGQGLNLGLGDVEELVQLLTGRAYWRGVDDLRLLRRYERARKSDFALVGQTGNALQQLFAQSHPAVRALRNCGMNGFEQSGPLKRWVARRAMGLHGNP